MRVYLIWNRGYSTQSVLANSLEEALELSYQSGHLRKRGNYRRWIDCTDEYLAREDAPGLDRLLEHDGPGVIIWAPGGWLINGKPVQI